jgi:endonuclease/exonuclease/phosphatase family metal-dependent hydrolase
MRRRTTPVYILVILVPSVVAALLVLLLAMEWRPPAIAPTSVEAPGSITAGEPEASSHLSLLTWNLGYAALDSSADFFMDGGTGVRAASPAAVRGNLAAISQYLAGHRADVVFLQEVDRRSSRSFDIDEAEALVGALPAWYHCYAPNYRVAWIPYPFLRPLGRVESGLLSLSRFRPADARRLQLPGRFPWPVRVFHLKRCLHELRFPAADGRDWVLINLHLSTFDSGGRLRKEEMAFLRVLLIDLAGAGDHVIAGGDWNQAFPDVPERRFPASSATPDWYRAAPAGWTPPGWRWAYDPEVPSLRATDRPYTPGVNFLTIMDGFLVGPGIEILSVKTDDLGFTHSDHQPVACEVALAARCRRNGLP